MFFITPDMFIEKCINEVDEPVNLDELISFKPTDKSRSGLSIMFIKDWYTEIFWEYETEQQRDKVFEEICKLVKQITNGKIIVA